MTLRLAVLRPEPGNTATADALAAAGHDVLRLPLFAVTPLGWTAPDPASVDALLLTSANAIRHAGDALTMLATLPVVTVGEATAAAARAAGLRVVATGSGDGAAARDLARDLGYRRLLHLAGREHRALSDVTVLPLYASNDVPVERDALTQLAGRTALVHSPRAARRLAAVIGRARATVAIAALSAAVAEAAGSGWRAMVISSQPTDAALRDAAVALAATIDRPGTDGDKQP